MRLKEAKTIGDVIKFLKMKAWRQDMYLVEVEQVHNFLIVTFWKPIEERDKEKEWHTLIYTMKIKKSNEKPMSFTRIKMNLCKLIEPFKSKKDYYDKMRAESQNIDIEGE